MHQLFGHSYEVLFPILPGSLILLPFQLIERNGMHGLKNNSEENIVNIINNKASEL